MVKSNMEVVKLGLILTIGIIGVFIIFGFIIEELNKLSRNAVYRAFGTPALYLTSFIGTPVHEFGHYIMCKIFLHKVVEVKWFIPSAVKNGGVLGYVKHGRSNSIYQKVGDFFIGIGPLIVGSIIVILLSRYLIPNTFNTILTMEHLNIKEVVVSIFSTDNLKNYKFWIFIILAVSICSHMSLSAPDVKNSYFGATALLVINMIFAYYIVATKMDLTVIKKFLYNYNLTCIILMSIAVLIILLTLIISTIAASIRRA